jgi:hypothetical protein
VLRWLVLRWLVLCWLVLHWLVLCWLACEPGQTPSAGYRVFAASARICRKYTLAREA